MFTREEDGTVHVNCNVHDHGCGEVGIFKAIVAEVLEISPDLVDLPESLPKSKALFSLFSKEFTGLHRIFANFCP